MREQEKWIYNQALEEGIEEGRLQGIQAAARICEEMAITARNAASSAETAELFERLDGQRRVLLAAMHRIRQI